MKHKQENKNDINSNTLEALEVKRLLEHSEEARTSVWIKNDRGITNNDQSNDTKSRDLESRKAQNLKGNFPSAC